MSTEMVKEICVIGHPSYLGGADTELLDQIKCWHRMGIKIYILHTGEVKEEYKKMDLKNKYNCTYLPSCDWKSTEGFHVISFCNGKFLENIAEIKKYAISTTFVNCMTWNFSKEIDAQYNGYIDFHLYQTKHGFEKVSPALKGSPYPYRPVLFQPYFDVEGFYFHNLRDNDKFRFGRISRADTQKFGKDQFKIYDAINRKDKAGLVLGWHLSVPVKCHIAKSDINKRKLNGFNGEGLFYKDYVQLLPALGNLQKMFYHFCDVMIMDSDTFENLPRVGFECMASGTIPIVNNRGGWTCQITNGIDGFLCNNTSEFIEVSNKLAENEELRREMRRNCWNKRLSISSFETCAKSWENYFQQLKKYEKTKNFV